MKPSSQASPIGLCLYALSILGSVASFAAEFKVNVFYPADAGIDSMIESSVASVSSPDFEVTYQPVSSTDWEDPGLLTDFLISTQQSAPADGFFLACRNDDLYGISDVFRLTFPKVPFVDSFAPALMAAHVVSYRYAIMTGSDSGEALVNKLISDLGVESHVRYGGSTRPIRDVFLVEMESFALTTPKDGVIPDVVELGLTATGDDRTDSVVLNIEAIVLAGCEGFLDLGVATGAQSQLSQKGVPLQVINPIKASMGLLYSMIRNKVWISVPRPL